MPGMQVLAIMRDGDAEALFAVFPDPAMMRYWSTPPWVASSGASPFVSPRVAATAPPSVQ